MRLPTILLATLLLVTASACATGETADTASAPASQAQLTTYRIQGGETVRVTTFGEETLTGEFRIGADGALAFPLVGRIMAAGMTLADVTAAIGQGLAGKYVNNPKVSVEVLRYPMIYVLGEVNKPGEYEYEPGMTLLSAVAKAGGFTYRAQKKQVYLSRKGSSEEVLYKVSPNLTISPGDTLRVGERYF